MAGLMVIGTIKPFGIDALQRGGMTMATASATAGTAMAVFYSLTNGLGRSAGRLQLRWQLRALPHRLC